MNVKRLTETSKLSAAAAALTLLLAASGSAWSPTRASAATPATRQASRASKFYCNMKALDPAERAQHQQLTKKLIAVRKKIVQMPRGYEFQYSPSDVSIAELAGWVTTEAKCCPFFNFHIDLEREGNLVCLGLTGEEGIKAFIRTEFQLPAKERRRVSIPVHNRPGVPESSGLLLMSFSLGRATSATSQSEQRVKPGRYSASQLG